MMALFSRRPKNSRAKPDSQNPVLTPAPEAVDPDAGSAGATEDPTPPDVAATMSISVSAYRGLGATGEQLADADPQSAQAAASQPAAVGPVETVRSSADRSPEAPPATETIPGLRDNVVLREALARVSSPPAAPEIIEVARQLLQGHLFLRVKGDARTLLAEGKSLPLGVASVGDKQYVLAYSSGTAIRDSVVADRDVDTSAMGQPVLTVVRYVLDGTYAGLIIDNSSAPARAVLPRELLQKIVDQADQTLEIKTLLSSERTDETAPAIAQALIRAAFWVAVSRSEEGRLGVAEARTAEGGRYLELYSHPLELASLGRKDQPAPMTASQLGKALRTDEQLSGVIIDPGGPWIRLSRADLAPVIALDA